MADQLNVRIPKSTDLQIEDLQTWTGMTQTQIVILSIDRLHQAYKHERKKMESEQLLIEQAEALPHDGCST